MSEEIEDLYLSWEFKNKKGHIGGLDIDTLEKTVVIWVDDSSYTFEIPFDKFLEISEKVKEVRRQLKEFKEPCLSSYQQGYREGFNDACEQLQEVAKNLIEAASNVD